MRVLRTVGQDNWIYRYAKPYTWRFTAVYCWLTAIAALFGFYATLMNAEGLLFQAFQDALSWFGFEPVNPGRLGAVFKLTWVLVITGFKPWGFVGLVFYILTFPILVSGSYILTKIIEAGETDAPITRTPLSEESGQWFRPILAFTILIGAWFVLYGGAEDWQRIAPGIVLSGILLLLLAFRLFTRVRPTASESTQRFPRLKKYLENTITQFPPDPTKEYSSRSEFAGEIAILRFSRRLLLWVVLLLRRQRVRQGVASLVFGEYMFSVIATTLVAIFFWALIISATASEPLSISDAMRLSFGHFIPGVDSPQIGVELPFWASAGPAASGWVLFVLYLAPAATVLPERQRAAMIEATANYHFTRGYLLAFGRGLRTRLRLRESFPQKK